MLTEQMKTALQLLFLLGLLTGAFFLIQALGGFSGGTETQRLQFKVDAAGGSAWITLDAGETSIRGGKTVSTPWSQTVRVKSGTEVYLTAANPNAVGHITCIILLNGVEWKKSSASAPKNGVACAGIVP